MRQITNSINPFKCVALSGLLVHLEPFAKKTSLLRLSVNIYFSGSHRMHRYNKNKYVYNLRKT